MKLILIVFLCSTSIFAQNITFSKPLSCHLADGSRTLLQGSIVTGSVVLSYINAVLPIIAEIVVAAIMHKLTSKSPGDTTGGGGNSGGGDGSGGDGGSGSVVVPVENHPLTSSAADLLTWYDRMGLTLFAAHATTSLPRVSQVFGNAFAKAGPETGSTAPSATTILTVGSAVVAVIAGAGYPMISGWCEYEKS